jgi:hypothetical protein
MPSLLPPPTLIDAQENYCEPRLFLGPWLASNFCHFRFV